MKDARAIVFDLDGTLTDSGSGIMNCYSYAIRQMGFEPPSEAILRSFVGPPLRDNLASIVGKSNVEEAACHYFDRMINQKIGILENKVYNGIQDVLERLHLTGRTLYIATSKRLDITTDLLAHFNLSGYFKGVYGANADGSQAEKTIILGMAINENNLDPQQTIMIGDRSHDIEGAKNHKLRSIGVGWGYGSEEELRSAGATAYARAPSDLLDILL